MLPSTRIRFEPAGYIGPRNGPYASGSKPLAGSLGPMTYVGCSGSCKNTDVLTFESPTTAGSCPQGYESMSQTSSGAEMHGTETGRWSRPDVVLLPMDASPSTPADVAPRNIPKRGIPTYLNENIPADYKTTVAKILELEQKLEAERIYKQYLEALASAAHITLEDR